MLSTNSSFYIFMQWNIENIVMIRIKYLEINQISALNNL